VANLKDIKTRIASVKKTRQITSAMKLVAAAKLRGATERAVAAKPYKEKLAGVLHRVAGAAGGDVSDPLLEMPDSVRKILVVVLTSDRGLCGGFNNNLMRQTQRWLDKKAEEGVECDVSIYGRKGRDFCKAKKVPVAEEHLDYSKQVRMEVVRELNHDLVAGYRDGVYDEVYVVYNVFKNAITQIPTFAKLLPMQVEDAGDDTASVNYLYEPGPETLLKTLLPLYLQTLVLQAFLETEAGELAARMTAMDNATRNASDLIGSLTLEYNRARQAAITTEIIEIVSGAEAL
jgi:F-type H+-transporting ATPase subunit gamma